MTWCNLVRSQWFIRSSDQGMERAVKTPTEQGGTDHDRSIEAA
jgi:hypothetical protein